MIEDYKFQLNELKTEISNVYEKLDTDSVEKKIKEKEQITENPGFWDNHEKAEKIMAEIRKLKKRIEPWKKLLLDYSDLEAMYDLALESSSSDDENEFIEEHNAYAKYKKLYGSFVSNLPQTIKTPQWYSYTEVWNILKGQVKNNELISFIEDRYMKFAKK